MTKQTKTLLTVGALAAVAYYFFKNPPGSPATLAEQLQSADATASGLVGANLASGLPGFAI